MVTEGINPAQLSGPILRSIRKHSVILQEPKLIFFSFVLQDKTNKTFSFFLKATARNKLLRVHLLKIASGQAS